MAPNLSFTGVLHENDAEIVETPIPQSVDANKPEKRKLELVWRNIILFAYLHLAALYGFWLMFTSAKWQTALTGKTLLFCCLIFFSDIFSFV